MFKSHTLKRAENYARFRKELLDFKYRGRVAEYGLTFQGSTDDTMEADVVLLKTSGSPDEDEPVGHFSAERLS